MLLLRREFQRVIQSKVKNESGGTIGSFLLGDFDPLNYRKILNLFAPHSSVGTDDKAKPIIRFGF